MRRRTADVRQEARESALQMLYQWEVGRGDLDEIVATSWAIQARSLDVDRDIIAGRFVRGTVANLKLIDDQITEASTNWRLERLAVLDRLILRLAIYELLFETDTPRAVVINEAIELARRFSTEDAVKFVNGVLDSIKPATGEQV